MKLVSKGIKSMNYWEGLVKGLTYFFLGGGEGLYVKIMNIYYVL